MFKKMLKVGAALALMGSLAACGENDGDHNHPDYYIITVADGSMTSTPFWGSADRCDTVAHAASVDWNLHTTGLNGNIHMCQPTH